MTMVIKGPGLDPLRAVLATPGRAAPHSRLLAPTLSRWHTPRRKVFLKAVRRRGAPQGLSPGCGQRPAAGNSWNRNPLLRAAGRCAENASVSGRVHWRQLRVLKTVDRTRR